MSHGAAGLQQAIAMMLLVASVLVQVLVSVFIRTSIEKRGELSRRQRLVAIALAAVFGAMFVAGVSMLMLEMAVSKLPMVLLTCGLSGAVVFGYTLLRRQPVDTGEMRKVIAQDL